MLDLERASPDLPNCRARRHDPRACSDEGFDVDDGFGINDQVLAQVTVVSRVWDAYVPFLPSLLGPLKTLIARGLQVVIVDNASRVPLPTVPEGVSVVRLDERVGPGAAANRGLAAVRSDYVCFADVDDILIPAAWDELVTLLVGDPDAVAACGRAMLWDPERGVLLGSSIIPADAPGLSEKQLARAIVLRNMFPVVGSLLRVDTTRSVGGWGEIPPPFEDWPLSLALAWRGRLLFSNTPSFYYRIHAASHLGATSRRDVIIGRLAVYREIRQRLRREPSVPVWLRVATWPMTLLHLRRAFARRKHRSEALDAPPLRNPPVPVPVAEPWLADGRSPPLQSR
jgi:Glycosyl transferase family 2.